jgi:hypothetical protein
MMGILPDKAREVYRIPEGVDVLTGLAIGYAADPTGLPDKIRRRDTAPRTRKPLAQFLFSHEWGKTSGLVQ